MTPPLRERAARFATKHQLFRRQQYARLAVVDALEFALRRRQADLPPRRLRPFVGGGDFRAAGHEFLVLSRRLGGLAPEERVLDIGCGFGRIAIALSSYLSENGSYDGIEIIPQAVKWCSRRITPTHPTFRFHHVDVYNRFYNPRGTLAAEALDFPFSAASFDFALLTSVFTHLLEDTVAHYLHELATVLAPGGRVLASAFLLDETSRAAVADGTSKFAFVHPVSDNGVMTSNPSVPEVAVAYPLEYIARLVEAAGLELVGVHPGSWSGRADGLSNQDVLILHRP